MAAFLPADPDRYRTPRHREEHPARHPPDAEEHRREDSEQDTAEPDLVGLGGDLIQRDALRDRRHRCTSPFVIVAP
jgi:hypothetical protein